jgi:hypothetical protein
MFRGQGIVPSSAGTVLVNQRKRGAHFLSACPFLCLQDHIYTMNCPYRAYFSSLVQQATFPVQLHSSFSEDITTTTTTKSHMAQQEQERCQHQQKNHNSRCRIFATNKTNEECIGEKMSAKMMMVVVADPAASLPKSLNRIRFQQHQEKAATSQRPLHSRWGVVDSPSRNCSHATHHQNRPPSAPIRKPSYDTWSNFEQSKTE